MIDKLKKLKVGKVVDCPKMKDYTTYKVGGECIAIVYPTNVENLIKLLKYLKENKIKYKVIGNGSNLIFSDERYDGVIINLKEFDKLEINDTIVKVGAGYSLVKLSIKTAKLGLAGLEFASGIPGTIGGAVFMNAGAYKSDMGYIVSEVSVLTPDLEVKTLYNKDLDFHYRTSFLQKNPDYICLEAKLVLRSSNSNILMDIISERKQRRLMTQPLEYPSAGSVFRNPENDFAGRLIEELGYKGKNIGGAYVSDKHANFIINKDHATASDIIKLITEIKEKVKEKYNIDLIVEQEIVD
ncbi:MAG TPA: UDP-N-acetylmuramate dehydrogenase [Candidatus Faecisoma merdavium]|nr:UDP-N-acetylmuramate dehydrogenase [Candidatus Faecisoma merdavium]